MACCGGIAAIDTDLKNLAFDDIYLQIDKGKLKFFPDEGFFKLVELDDKGKDIGGEVGQLDDEIKRLNLELKGKDNKIVDLKEKIGDIDKKIESMMQILKIDTSEREYINDLEFKIKEEEEKKKSVIN